MSEIPITASAVSNYAGMDALVGEDGRVYLGTSDRHPAGLGTQVM